jgi:23S rRNA G2445 N2-methylase RlmL
VQIDPTVAIYDVARAQHERVNKPTVVVPVLVNRAPTLVWASYHGDPIFDRLSRQPENQAHLAITCCRAAYAGARSRYGAHPLHLA